MDKINTEIFKTSNAGFTIFDFIVMIINSIVRGLLASHAILALSATFTICYNVVRKLQTVLFSHTSGQDRTKPI